MNGAARTRLLAAHARPFVNGFLEGRYQGLIAACVHACMHACMHMITCKSTFAVLVSFHCDIFCIKTNGRTLILLNRFILEVIKSFERIIEIHIRAAAY